MRPIKRRVQFWKESLSLWWLTIYAIWTLFSNAATLRDNFLPPVLQARWATLAVLPRWGWKEWTLGNLVIGLVAVLEGCYRRFSQEQDLVLQKTAELKLLRSVQNAPVLNVTWRDEAVYTGIEIENRSLDKDAYNLRLVQFESPSFIVTGDDEHGIPILQSKGRCLLPWRAILKDSGSASGYRIQELLDDLTDGVETKTDFQIEYEDHTHCLTYVGSWNLICHIYKPPVVGLTGLSVKPTS